VFAGIFVGGDFGPDGMQPFVAVGVIEMPVRVDQMPDRLGTDAIQGPGDSGP